jgi:hypothetical protein
MTWPRKIQNGKMEANTIEAMYKGIPVITRTYMTGCILAAIGITINFLTPLQLFLNWSAIRTKYEVGVDNKSN